MVLARVMWRLFVVVGGRGILMDQGRLCGAFRDQEMVIVADPKETATPSTIIHTEAKSKDKGKGILVEEPKPLKKQADIEQDKAYARELEAELNKNIDWDEVIDHVQRKEKEVNALKRYQALKRKPQTEAQARKNMMIYPRNVAGFKMDYFKGMTYDDIRPIFEKEFNSNVAFLQKTKEKMEEEDSRALKRLSETQKEKAAKKQKLDEEVAELKRHIQIVPNDEDDVYTEATPLACKVSVVDYEIYTLNNKPYYKIIRADGSPHLFLSFLSLLRNFDREDLEVLWELVKERFASSKPKNFLDDCLLTTLTYMFEKPDVQAQVWKSQRTVHGLAKINIASSSGSDSLPSNTIANPRGDLNAITTRSGVAYVGPTIPPTPLSKEVEHETEATEDKLPEKLRDPGRFLIPCDSQRLESCMALADLGGSINLMPLFVWKKLSLPDLTSTRMTLELDTRNFSHPAGIAEDVFVQVGKFTFPANLVIVDYDVEPRIPLILGRPFLMTARALVDVHGEELILRDGDEQLIFHAYSTSKHPHKHGNESINMINLIDITCEDHFLEVLKFKKLNHPSSGSTTPFSDSSPSLTPFETSDSLLKEFTDELDFLDLIPPGKEDNNFNFEADLREIEFLLHLCLVKNRQSVMVSKRNERISELKNRKRDMGLKTDMV
uniref:Reverse transcriptase domain-containing protein n=1 Tax=Tanacetum cinerariifolium TaxID=118510 RepID=A0A6L2LD81_TANCI|nr:reverse transcriptase domain-containing protein [Tanacetum cinerariifolium]